jgi:hypothetical protein
VPPGWYIDPVDPARSRQRWWDGAAWTVNVAQPGTVPPGWYIDPVDPDRSRLRWWNGAEWTEHAADPEPTNWVAAPSRVGAWLLLGAGIAVCVGSMLPWASVTTVFGTIHVDGTQGDGTITLALGVGLIVMGVLGCLTARWPLAVSAMLAFVTSALAGVVAALDIVNVRDMAAEPGGRGMAVTSVGVGLWTVAAGATIGVVSAILLGRASVRHPP